MSLGFLARIGGSKCGEMVCEKLKEEAMFISFFVVENQLGFARA
jgi:hypothetical protein